MTTTLDLIRQESERWQSSRLIHYTHRTLLLRIIVFFYDLVNFIARKLLEFQRDVKIAFLDLKLLHPGLHECSSK